MVADNTNSLIDFEKFYQQLQQANVSQNNPVYDPFSSTSLAGKAGMTGSNDIFGGNPNASSIWGNEGFGLNRGTFSAVGAGIGAAKDLAGLYTGYKQMQMAKEQMRTNKAFGNRNIANQAQTINTSLEAKYRAALAGEGPNSGRESVDSYMSRNRVDGSAVGGG